MSDFELFPCVGFTVITGTSAAVLDAFLHLRSPSCAYNVIIY